MLLIGFLNPAFFGCGSCGCQRNKHGVFILLLNSLISFTAGRRLGAVSWGPFEQNGGNLSGGGGLCFLPLESATQSLKFLFKHMDSEDRPFYLGHTWHMGGDFCMQTHHRDDAVTSSQSAEGQPGSRTP